LLIGARLGSPLVLGIGQGENFLASDPGALVGQVEKVVYLSDRQMCVLSSSGWHLLDAERVAVEGACPRYRVGGQRFDKGVFDHYMLKEIYEQPEALENALRGRLADDECTASFRRA